MPRHLYTLKRMRRLAVQQAPHDQVLYSNRKPRCAVWHPNSWSANAGYRSEHFQHLLQCNIATAKYITLTWPTPFPGKQYAFGHISHIHQIKTGIYIGRNLMVKKIYDDLARGRWLYIGVAHRRTRIHNY